MKISTLPLCTLALAVATLPLGAQTAASHAVHHTTGQTAHTAGCATPPRISPAIPALPASAPCPRILYTLTHVPDTHLDYASPLLSADVRDELSGKRSTYSLIYVDTQIGAGPLVQSGKYLTVHYTGYLADGKKFDSSVDRGEPITFPYGSHRVIPGWDTGFEGMHVGGKRRLYIPYQLAYGEAGRPPMIPARSELIFDVQLISQSDQMPKPTIPFRRSMPVHPAPKPSAPAQPSTTPPANPQSSTTQPANPQTPK